MEGNCGLAGSIKIGLCMDIFLQGDRVGICLTQLDPDKMERGWLCAPGSVLTFRSAIASVKKIKFYIGTLTLFYLASYNLHV